MTTTTELKTYWLLAEPTVSGSEPRTTAATVSGATKSATPALTVKQLRPKKAAPSCAETMLALSSSPGTLLQVLSATPTLPIRLKLPPRRSLTRLLSAKEMTGGRTE